MSETRVRAGLTLLESRGYRVHASPRLLGRVGYLANDDDVRADELNAALRDPDTRAIMVARGGYGIMRILEQLDSDALRADPKLIIGFSDATALLSWAMRCAGVRGIHGPMVEQLATLPGDDLAWLFQLMENATPAGLLPMTPAMTTTTTTATRAPTAPTRATTAPTRATTAATPAPTLTTRAPTLTTPATTLTTRATTAATRALVPIGARASAHDEAITGTLMGGNLCLLAHLVGTPYGLDMAWDDLVLALEEVGERPYRVDRYLTQLGLAGVLGRAVAALIGDFTDCAETVHADHPEAMAVVHERLTRYQVPGLAGIPMAHGTRNLALPLGARCAVHMNSGRVRLLDAAVS